MSGRRRGPSSAPEKGSSGYTEGLPSIGGKGINTLTRRRVSNRSLEGISIPNRPDNAAKGCWRIRKVQIGILLVLVVIAFSLGVLVGRSLSPSGIEKNFLPPDNEPRGNGWPPPNGWIWYNNTSYYYAEEKLNWTSSKKYCEQHGAQLAVLTERHIEENVKRFKKYSVDHWYGYYKQGNEWKWLNETSIGEERLNNISGRNCGVWNPTERWDNDCSSRKPFICLALPH